MTPASKPKVNRYCKTGLWGSLCIIGLCFIAPVLLGLTGLAFLRQYVDYYVLLPLFVICLLFGLYGWSRGGKISGEADPSKRFIDFRSLPVFFPVVSSKLTLATAGAFMKCACSYTTLSPRFSGRSLETSAPG